jgi:CRP-like cAMP-binding protein
MTTVAEGSKVRLTKLGDELDKQEADALASVMGAKTIRDMETLVNENDANSTLYILVEGRMEVLSKIDGQDVPVYTMTKGECAGTRAFVDRRPRKATLRAAGDATVYTLEPDKFESLLNSHPRVVYKVMRALFRITHRNLMRMNQETQQLTNYINKTHGRY